MFINYYHDHGAGHECLFSILEIPEKFCSSYLQQMLVRRPAFLFLMTGVLGAMLA